MLTIEHVRIEDRSSASIIEGAINLRFPCGILGFEKIKAFKLHRFRDIHPFLWLEGPSESGLCFLVVPPVHVVDSYPLELTDDDVNFLELQNPEQATVLNIATFHPNGAITVNLKGPLVYNAETLVGRQVVPKNAMAWSIKHPVGN